MSIKQFHARNQRSKKQISKARNWYAVVENESTGKVIKTVWVTGVVICNKGGTPSAECPAIVAKFLCIKSKADTRVFLESIYEFSNTNKGIIIIKLK